MGKLRIILDSLINQLRYNLIKEELEELRIAIEEKDISNKAVLEKIAKLIDEAEEHEMTYAIHALGELREHIITLSR